MEKMIRKNNPQIQPLLLCPVLLGSTVSFAGQRTVYENTEVRERKAVVFIKTSLSGQRNVPLRELSFALKHRPRATRFKVSWDLGGLNDGSGLVVYNRTRKTAELFAYASGAEGSHRVHIFYTSFSETMIDKASQAEHLDTDNDNQPDYFGYFDELPKQGCHRRYLSDVTSGNW